MIDITALGEILIDFTPINLGNGKHSYEQNAGGAPANLLATFARFGGKTAFIGKVGNDMFGDFLIQTLRENQIDDRGVVVDQEHNTTLAFVALDENGDRKFSFCRKNGADVFLKKEEIQADLIQNSKIFHFGSLSLTDEPAKAATDRAISLAKSCGCTVSFDPNYRPLLWKTPEKAIEMMKRYVSYADIVKISREELEMMTDETDILRGIQHVLDRGVKIVLVTDGANGVTYATKAFSGFVPSLSVKVVDTTGAGDIFFGTFLYAFSRHEINFDIIDQNHIENAVKLAVRVSGLSTTKKGAIPSIPTKEELKAL